MSISSQVMLGRFKGCLLGAFAGDCLGAPFEGEGRIALSVLNYYVTKLADPSTKGELMSVVLIYQFLYNVFTQRDVLSYLQNCSPENNRIVHEGE